MQVNTKLKVVGHAEVHPFTYKIDADGRKVDLLVSGVNPVIRICGDKSMLIQVDGGAGVMDGEFIGKVVFVLILIALFVAMILDKTKGDRE